MRAVSLILLFVLNAPALAGAECSIVDSEPRQFQTAFERLHDLSEQFYDGNGSWGTSRTGYRMALRDSAWRAEVYSNVENPSPLYQQRAEAAIEYLVQAQKQAGNGVFGMPADINNPEFGSRIREILRRCPQCVKSGWINTLPDEKITELYYDHGFALSALSQAYLRSGKAEWLEAIRKGADWALDKPVTHNINYLSTLSKGLSHAARATGDARYLARAVDLHRHHILPNITARGDARDSHNARLEYHAFIVSGLATLRLALPASHEFSPSLDQALQLTTARLTERSLQEPATRQDSWPGAALHAWHDLSMLRLLTGTEHRAWERTLALASDQTLHFPNEASVFQKQKMLNVNFSLGYFLPTRTPCTQP